MATTVANNDDVSVFETVIDDILTGKIKFKMIGIENGYLIIEEKAALTEDGFDAIISFSLYRMDTLIREMSISIVTKPQVLLAIVRYLLRLNELVTDGQLESNIIDDAA